MILKMQLSSLYGRLRGTLPGMRPLLQGWGTAAGPAPTETILVLPGTYYAGRFEPSSHLADLVTCDYRSAYPPDMLRGAGAVAARLLREGGHWKEGDR